MIRKYAARVGVVALCSAALCTVPMMAQGGGGGGRGPMTPDAQLAQLTTALTLTADQQAKIKPILEADAAKITALRTASGPGHAHEDDGDPHGPARGDQGASDR